MVRHLLLPALLLLGYEASGAPQERRRPNFVVVLIDDLGWNGSPIRMDPALPASAMPLLEMPRLEQFARQSMQFRNAYAGGPQCSPGRVCLQTGLSAARSGFTVFMEGVEDTYPEPNVDQPEHDVDVHKHRRLLPVLACTSDLNLDREETTIAEALAPLGYRSALFGKWHMRGNGPGDHGYSESDGNTNGAKSDRARPEDPKQIFSITRRSIDFVRRQVREGRPFHLQVSHYALHSRWECRPETHAKYAGHPALVRAFEGIADGRERARALGKAARWFGMAEDLDAAIGQLLDELVRLGIADETYVVVTSDNGMRHEEAWSAVGQGPFPMRGSKWWIWDGGLRVPLWVRGPGIPGGEVCHANVAGYDLLPTFHDLAGGEAETLGEIDGSSLRELLHGAEDPAFGERPLYFHYPHYRGGVPGSAIVSGRWKVVHLYEQPEAELLFDTWTDAGETRSLAGEHPEVYAGLKERLFTYLADVGARMPIPNPDHDAEELAAWYAAKESRLEEKAARDRWRWPGTTGPPD